MSTMLESQGDGKSVGALARSAIATVLTLTPATALAGNGNHPRTPVLWPETPCRTVVDRSAEPILGMEYTIPYEDIDATPDEVVDSRRHQFLAFCRGANVQEPYPTWITWKDVDAADAKGLATPDLSDADVLETSPEWKNCFVRITGDDQRRPITFAEAMTGVNWDLAGIAAGPYLIHGYTWEPAFNAYWPTNGYVQVIDGPDRSAALPGLGIYYGDTDGSGIIWADQTLKIRGCPYALPDSKITAYWSPPMPITWTPFATELVIDGESEFEVEFIPPPEAASGLRVMFRLDLVDPMGREFSAHVSHLGTVLPGDAPEMSETCDGNGFIAEESCGGESSTSASPTSGSGSSSSDGGSADSGPAVEPGSGSGCACSTLTGAGGAPLGLLIASLARRRRRAHFVIDRRFA